MNDKIAITEGTRGRYFSPVDKLKINNVSTGSSYWVLEETSEVDSLDVTKNGQYYAVNDDLDGYDQVNVNISPELDEDDLAKGKKITGKEQDGNDYEYGKDEDGNLTTEMVPAAIHIVVPPRKTKYEDGETIDFTGIHVYLMDGDNKRYTDEAYPTGEIPFGELMFPVTVASSSSSRVQYYEYDGAGWEDGIRVQGSVYTKYTQSGLTREGTYTGRIVIAKCSGEGVSGAFVSENPGVIGNENVTIIVNGNTIHRTEPYSSSTPITRNNKTCYAFQLSVSPSGFQYDEWSPDIPEPLGPLNEEVFWNAVYGKLISEEDSDKIPVQWIRSDGEILEDNFEIEVGSGGQPEPPQPDPWAGSADVSWNGHHYNLNRRIVPAVHYANGYCWQEGTSEYTVEQAASMGWLILIR